MTEDVPFYVELARESEGRSSSSRSATGASRSRSPARPDGRVLGIDIVARDARAGTRARRRRPGSTLELREGDMRDLELDEPAGLIYVPFRSLGHLPTWADRRRVFERVHAVAATGRPLRLELFVFDPRIAARIDGEWQEQNGIRHRIDQVKHDNRIDITLESGDAISLWWLNRSEWEGPDRRRGLRGRGALRRLRAAAVRRDRERVRLGCPQASPYDPIARVYDPWSASVTEDVEFYVEEARASGGPVVELACGTGRISVPDRQGRHPT